MAQAALICRGVPASVSATIAAAESRKLASLRTCSSSMFISSSAAAAPAGIHVIGCMRLRDVGVIQTFALFGSKPASKPKTTTGKVVKEKTVDGIFGTSGGIGFTKANELFVARVAMLGFAGEALTGKGTQAQFDIETGVPLNQAEPLLLFFILFTLLGAIGALGDRGRFVDAAAPITGLDRAVISPGKGVKSALGLNEKGPTFGFTKANELFVGHLAQLGIAFSIIGEIIAGNGTLAQLNIENGVPITDLEPLVLFNVAYFLVAAINPGTGKFVIDDDVVS